MSRPASIRILLASASPRRLQLLRQIGLEPEVLPVDIDETALAGEGSAAQALRLARIKAETGWRQAGSSRDCLAIGADTLIDLDGDALGKPRDETQAIATLLRLSGRTHTVFSAVAICRDRVSARLSRSRVRFRVISEAQAAAYWRSGEPAGKAGAYAIQGLGAIFIQQMTGSYSGVMGLPLFETAAMLAEAGVAVMESVDGRR